MDLIIMSSNQSSALRAGIVPPSFVAATANLHAAPSPCVILADALSNLRSRWSTFRSSTLDGDRVAVFVVTVFRILVNTEHLQDGKSI
jgi:hypothetical protein